MPGLGLSVVCASPRCILVRTCEMGSASFCDFADEETNPWRGFMGCWYSDDLQVVGLGWTPAILTLESTLFFFFFWVFIEFVIILLLFFYDFLFFWPWGMWDLRSPTRDQTCTPCIGRWSPNHWTTREVPGPTLLATALSSFDVQDPGSKLPVGLCISSKK